MKTQWIYAMMVLIAGFGLSQEEKGEYPRENFQPPANATKVEKHPKLSTALLTLTRTFMKGPQNALDMAEKRGMMVENGDEVLVEMRVDPKQNDQVGEAFREQGFRIRHNTVPGLFEAWLPIFQLEQIVTNKNIQFVRPARRVDLVVGNSDTQGLAASLANVWHTNGFDGTGVTLANIDGGYEDYTLRQASGDWPTGAAVTLINTNGGAFGTDTPHGTATVEINYDMAPGATYRIYETTTISDWYSALTDATANGADVVSVSLGAPLDGVGDGTDCPPGWGAPCGTIAEASTAARNAGVLVVNAAGNERESHWGGLYAPLAGSPNTLDWGSGGNVNFMPFCIGNGATLQFSMYWDDWTGINHDYDLRLVEWDDTNNFWVTRATAADPQNGGAGQSPQEFLSYTTTGVMGAGNVCPVNSGFFGLVVDRFSAATNRNIQIFAALDLDQNVPARSLGFPADSPSVMTVAAIDQGTFAQESYSSEGPVLGPGGSLAASTIDKPDIAAFANVDTEAYGAGIFNGTSAATPHVAGAAALVLEAFPSYQGVPEATQEFLENCAVDQGVAGWDTLFGAGRLQMCDGDYDVWTRDNGSDTGVEPHYTGSIWNSPDIKICQTANCPSSENPEFGQTNYVYVTLRNNGPNATAPHQPAVGNLELYYSSAGGSAQWMSDWTLINTVPVTLQGGEVREVEVPWTNVPATGHYCMLSRWVSVDDPMTFTEVLQTTTNVRENNNISWKNFTVVNLLANIVGSGSFQLRNIFEDRRIDTELAFNFADREGRFINEGGAVRVNMDADTFRRWRETGEGRDIKIVGENRLQIVGPRAAIMLPMDPRENVDLTFEFEAREPFAIKGKQVNFDLDVVQLVDKEDVGGVRYSIRARGLDTDTDGDRIPDIEDEDDDNDGIPDAKDKNPLNRKLK